MAIEMTTSKYGNNGRTIINTGHPEHDVTIAAQMLASDAWEGDGQIEILDPSRAMAAIVQFAFQTPSNQEIVVFYDGIRATLQTT